MIKAELDQPKLERSLKRFAKGYGDTQAQAVIRWSVQVCRELALETQAVPKDKSENPRKKQEGAMMKDAMNVLLVVETLEKTRGNGYRATNQGKKYGVTARKALLDAEQVNNWIEINRTKRNARTAQLPLTERMVCDMATFKAAMKIRLARAGMAKGAWLGAGMDIARAQTGSEKMNIGKNFLSYTQKHQRWGDAKKPVSGWKPAASITNKLAYSGNSRVLHKSSISKAIKYGLSKTVKFYQKALRAMDKKDKA